MELLIMKLMPFGILLYVGMGNPGYFDSLYHNLTGIAIIRQKIFKIYVDMQAPADKYQFVADQGYHNLTGIAIMTGCLAVYSGAYALGESVMSGIEAQLL